MVVLRTLILYFTKLFFNFEYYSIVLLLSLGFLSYCNVNVNRNKFRYNFVTIIK